jgi:hypothetical protein
MSVHCSPAQVPNIPVNELIDDKIKRGGSRSPAI